MNPLYQRLAKPIEEEIVFLLNVHDTRFRPFSERYTSEAVCASPMQIVVHRTPGNAKHRCCSAILR